MCSWLLWCKLWKWYVPQQLISEIRWLFCRNTLTSTDLSSGVTLRFIYFTDRSTVNFLILKLITHQQMYSDWSIYLTVCLLYDWMVKMNKRLHDMIPYELLLDVTVCQYKYKKKTNIINSFIRYHINWWKKDNSKVLSDILATINPFKIWSFHIFLWQPSWWKKGGWNENFE